MINIAPLFSFHTSFHSEYFQHVTAGVKTAPENFSGLFRASAGGRTRQKWILTGHVCHIFLLLSLPSPLFPLSSFFFFYFSLSSLAVAYYLCFVSSPVWLLRGGLCFRFKCTAGGCWVEAPAVRDLCVSGRAEGQPCSWSGPQDGSEEEE